MQLPPVFFPAGFVMFPSHRASLGGAGPVPKRSRAAASCLAICIQNGRFLPGTLLHSVEFC